jgi:hypothetical protein
MTSTPIRSACSNTRKRLAWKLVSPTLRYGSRRLMQLYVCYGTFGPVERHACGRARHALRLSGYNPDVVRTYGCFRTDRLFSGRRKVKHMTGNYKVPTLVLDDGSVIDGSHNIVAWAKANAAGSREARQAVHL